MAYSRSKRLIQLALRTEEISNTEEKEHSSINMKRKSIDYDTTEFEKEEDPWIEYKKWKEVEGLKNSEVRTVQKYETELNEDQSNFYEGVVDSSVSWVASEEETFDSDSNSYQSDIINVQGRIEVERSVLHKASEEEIEDNLNVLQIHHINTDSEIKEPDLLKNTNTTPKLIVLQNVTLNPPDQITKTGTVQKELSTQKFGVIANTRKLVEVSHRKGRVWDKRDRCIYCDRDFTNFSRHLFRNHENQDSVQKIMQLPKGHKNRKKMINLLRNEGNLALIEENRIRPVQRPTQLSDQNLEEVKEFLPCPFCKGIYRLSSLRKHSKICSYKPSNVQKCNIASMGQNLLVFKESRKSFYDKLRIKTEVFPNMHADRASFNGKTDPVICQYAEDYLRKHKRPHIRNAVSNKIRELGRILIPLQDIYGIRTLLEAMNTVHYDKVVQAAHIISGYDENTKIFKSPSLAMHLKTILLAACLAAKTLLLKEDPILQVTNYTEVLKTVKNFRLLVDERWRFDMGSLALKDLNEKHGKKMQKLPLTSDVIKFRKYAVSIAEESMAALKENVYDLASFKKLTEAILVLTILLNRKRVGDVQYIKLDSYKVTTSAERQEECLNVLSDSEKLLVEHFKRIITIGKGSKSIPILFPKNIQTFIEVLLSSRAQNQFVPMENTFLFALVGSTNQWVNGSAVLRNYAANCGAINPETLTSSRLRKQIATVLQIINLSETEKEQVASFMGHTKKTHEEFYRLPQEVYQTAKIAKLLLMMDRGEGAENEGKTLDEIDCQIDRLIKKDDHLNENDVVSNHDNEVESVVQDEYRSTELDFNITSISENSGKNKETTKKKRGSWSGKQKLMMKEYFKRHINEKITPKKHECDDFRKKYNDQFQDKTWVQIKVFIYNTFKN